MKIYVVIITDRHSDDTLKLFKEHKDAIGEAEKRHGANG